MLARDKVVDNFLFLVFFTGLFAANFTIRVEQEKRMTYQRQAIQLPTPDNGELEVKIAELERLYHCSDNIGDNNFSSFFTFLYQPLV